MHGTDAAGAGCDVVRDRDKPWRIQSSLGRAGPRSSKGGRRSGDSLLTETTVKMLKFDNRIRCRRNDARLFAHSAAAEEEGVRIWEGEQSLAEQKATGFGCEPVPCRGTVVSVHLLSLQKAGRRGAAEKHRREVPFDSKTATDTLKAFNCRCLDTSRSHDRLWLREHFPWLVIADGLSCAWQLS